jgi:subtilase family serine protease
VTLPSTTSPASYFLIAKADGAGTVPETTETNNTFARAIQIGGDLTVSVFTAPAKGGAGLSMTVTDTTTNPGAGPVGSSVTKFYFSTNSSFDAADVLLGSRDVPTLGAGASSTLNTTILIPSNAAVGTSYVIARADGDGTVVETNESNNTIARSVYIGSDLIVSEPSAMIKAGVGSSIDVTDTVTNQGGGASGPSTTRYYLSTNTSLSVDDVLLGGGRDVPGLAPGAVNTGSTTVWLPAGGAPGVFYVIAKADGDSAVPETAETNNTASRTVAIGPDLIISASSAPGGSIPAGTTITVNDTVLNQGGDAAMPTSTRIYLSTNSTLDAADIALGTGRAVPTVAAGTSNGGATSITIPSTTSAGFYYLLAKADGDNAIAESYENNNVLYRGIYVTAAP